MKRIEQQKPVVDSVRDCVMLYGNQPRPWRFFWVGRHVCLRDRKHLCALFAAGYFGDGDQRQMQCWLLGTKKPPRVDTGGALCVLRALNLQQRAGLQTPSEEIPRLFQAAIIVTSPTKTSQFSHSPCTLKFLFPRTKRNFVKQAENIM